jgi:hypothetical protein
VFERLTARLVVGDVGGDRRGNPRFCDREFVGSLATRVIEMKAEGIVDFHGGYDDYLRSQGVGDLQLPRRVSR